MATGGGSSVSAATVTLDIEQGRKLYGAIMEAFPGAGKRDTKKRRAALDVLYCAWGATLYAKVRDAYEVRKWWVNEQSDAVAVARQDEALGIKERTFTQLYHFRMDVPWDGKLDDPELDSNLEI